MKTSDYYAFFEEPKAEPKFRVADLLQNRWKQLIDYIDLDSLSNEEHLLDEISNQIQSCAQFSPHQLPSKDPSLVAELILAELKTFPRQAHLTALQDLRDSFVKHLTTQCHNHQQAITKCARSVKVISEQIKIN